MNHHREDRTLPHFNHLYAHYKRRAQRSKFSFELTKKQFRWLTKGRCHYCSQGPLQVYDRYGCKANVRHNAPYIYNGIDRVDPTKGYIFANCVSCCWTCNNMKSDLTVRQFYEHIEKIQKNEPTE